MELCSAASGGRLGACARHRLPRVQSRGAAALGLDRGDEARRRARANSDAVFRWLGTKHAAIPDVVAVDQMRAPVQIRLSR